MFAIHLKKNENMSLKLIAPCLKRFSASPKDLMAMFAFWSVILEQSIVPTSLIDTLIAHSVCKRRIGKSSFVLEFFWPMAADLALLDGFAGFVEFPSHSLYFSKIPPSFFPCR
jgi:hypothetical protein